MTDKTSAPTKRIDFQPIGRRLDVPDDANVLDAAQAAGVDLVAVCGGEGLCGKCIVRPVEGDFGPVSDLEREWLSDEDLAAGHRLACQLAFSGAVRVHVPPESLSLGQRLQVESETDTTVLQPAVAFVDVTVPPPHLHDLRADTTRLKDSLVAVGWADAAQLELDPILLAQVPLQLRQQDWQGRVARHDQTIIGFWPRETAVLGLAVDIGTTKIAAYLLDLADGRVLAQQGTPNPQIAYGEDVISRIAYANRGAAAQETLQRVLIDSLNTLANQLCTTAGADPTQMAEAVLVGNTAMHHLLLGLPVTQLGEAPYVPAVGEALTLRAADLGLNLALAARVYLPPNIAGYVGGDHVAMLLATAAAEQPGAIVALDIGTNTEISLAVEGRLLTCSCASGPAFEGAHIQDGMRAAPGAIERVQFNDGQIFLQTIDDVSPVGLCGSGILDAIGEMTRVGAINQAGRLARRYPGVTTGPGGGYFTLVPEADSGHGRPVYVTRSDVKEIQLAKGAIRAGVEVLLAEAGLNYEQLDQFIVAGAFGTYLDLAQAVRIGMFPPLPLTRFRQVGNAAGGGARQLLLDRSRREALPTQLRAIDYIELTTYPGFVDLFTEAILFPTDARQSSGD